MRSERRPAVLFVCSGNVFRSVSAERIFNHQLKSIEAGLQTPGASSAGTHAIPQAVRPEVARHLRSYEVDVSDHMPRRVSDEILEQVDLVIAMSYDHRTFLKDRFGLPTVLFNEVAVGADTPILDVGEATPNWKEDPVQALSHATRVIDYLWSVMPAFIERVPGFLPRQTPNTTSARCSIGRPYVQSN